jgi:hypothetical protein
MALTAQQITDIKTAFPQLVDLNSANTQAQAASSLAQLKATGQSIADQLQTLVGQANGLAVANPTFAPEINAAKASLIVALKSALGL